MPQTPASPKGAHSAPADRPFAVTAVAIVTVAVFLRLYNLGSEEIWVDEAVSAHLISVPGWFPVFENNTPPLYYTLLWLWSLVAGTTEAGLRALSALVGSLFVLATICMGKTLFNRLVGLWSGLFVAVSPMAIYYSQEARTYSLMVLFVALAYTTLWMALVKGSRASWALFGLCSLLSLYTHYLAAMALVPTALLLLLWPARERRSHAWSSYLCVVALCAVFSCLWLLSNLSRAGRSRGSGGRRHYGRKVPPGL